MVATTASGRLSIFAELEAVATLSSFAITTSSRVVVRLVRENYWLAYLIRGLWKGLASMRMARFSAQTLFAKGGVRCIWRSKCDNSAKPSVNVTPMMSGILAQLRAILLGQSDIVLSQKTEAQTPIIFSAGAGAVS